jgi:hypothetical protein
VQQRMDHRSEAIPRLDPLIARRLRAVADRLQRYVLIEGLAWVVAFLVLASALQLGLDYWQRLQWSMRAALLALIAALAAWLFWQRVVAPLMLRVSPAEAAHLIERRYPQLGSHLLSAVQFAGGEIGPPAANSPALAASVVRRAGEALEGIHFASVVDPRRARRAAGVLGVAAAFVIGAWTISPDVMAMWFARNVMLQDLPWWQRTRLIVDIEGDTVAGARGDDIEIRAIAEGEVPREVEIIFETASGKRGRESMVRVGQRGFRHTVKDAQQNLSFYLEGGDDRTATYHLVLSDRPRVEESRMEVTPPAYTRGEAFTLGSDRRAVQVLPGSDITLSITTNKPVTQARLMAGGEALTEASHSGGWLTATFSPAESQTYHFALKDEIGLENRRPTRFSIRIGKDEPPQVRLRLSGGGEMITPQAILPIEMEFADTYGLATAELLCDISRPESSQERIELEGFRRYSTTFNASLSYEVQRKGASPGERISFKAYATDFDDVSGPNISESLEVALRVTTVDELLAELARREQELRAQFERLVDNQEQVRRQWLTVLGRSPTEMSKGEWSTALAPIERKQRTIANSVNVVRQQFEQVLGEMRVNQLNTLAVEDRLGRRIIQPLSELAKRDLVLAADALRRLARDGEPEQASQIDPQQVAVLAKMRSVLAEMLQWEGYQEVVSMLRDIIRLQTELNDETKQHLLDEADRLFEDWED